MTIEEQSAEYMRRMMTISAHKALVNIEMGYADPVFSQLNRLMEDVAKNNPVIILKLALTKCERIIDLHEEKGSFDPKDIKSRAEQIAVMSTEERNHALEDFDQDCQRRYLISSDAKL